MKRFFFFFGFLIFLGVSASAQTFMSVEKALGTLDIKIQEFQNTALPAASIAGQAPSQQVANQNMFLYLRGNIAPEIAKDIKETGSVSAGIERTFSKLNSPNVSRQEVINRVRTYYLELLSI